MRQESLSTYQGLSRIVGEILLTTSGHTAIHMGQVDLAIIIYWQLETKHIN